MSRVDSTSPSGVTADVKTVFVYKDEVPSDTDGKVLPATHSGEKRYKLVEIFESVKGEGTQAGVPMVFVRFSKCNLACTWCDTPYNRVAIELARSELAANIAGRDPAWVIFTGGEPCLQLDRALLQAVETARTGEPGAESGTRFALETNGMIWSEAIPYIDYINISPKLGEPVADEWFTLGRPVNEVRYTICDGQPDIWNVRTGEFLDGNASTERLGLNTEQITISPAFSDGAPLANFKSGEGFRSQYGAMDTASFHRCLYLVNKYRHFNARLSVQVHRLIGVR